MKYDRAYWLERVDKQRKWIDQCGGDAAGYIENYHGKHGRSLENAKAIWDADYAELLKLEKRANECTKR